LLALEAAQQLAAAGEEVGLLVLFQTIHPAAAKFAPETGLSKRWWYRVAKRVDLERENLSIRGRQYIWERLRHVGSRGSARLAVAFDHLMGGRQRPVSRSSMAYILEAITIESFKAREKYKVRPYSGDAVLFRASKQLNGLISGPDLGWANVLRGNLDICEAPGHQESMLSEPHVSHLAKELTERLQTAQQKHRRYAAGSVDAPPQQDVLSRASQVLSPQ
jgi:thioesterase domain-containing protein